MSEHRQGPCVYVSFGFHINTYHSYRGDSPDEHGFGQDLRLIRSILDTLDEANTRGVPVTAVWDTEQLFSIEECISVHDPALLERIRGRVNEAGDEVIYMSYNNGLVSAMQRDELDTVLGRSRTNDAGSGLEDLFTSVSGIVRPQEMMTSGGSFDRYREHGIDAVCLYYSATPFDAFRLFVEPLSAEQAHNPLRLEREEGESFRVLPTYHPADIIEHVSLRHWVKQLHRLQRSGEISGDVLLFINFDADSELWSGLGVPKPLRIFPNTRGLSEMIESIERLDFVRFTTLGEYFETHEDAGSISFSQDTADGAWNGYASWSEKVSSSIVYSAISDDRALAAAAQNLTDLLSERQRQVVDDSIRDAFEIRLRLLSTTSFGLATPFVAPARERLCKALIERLQSCHETVLDTIGGALSSAKRAAGNGHRIEIVDGDRRLLGVVSSSERWPDPQVLPHLALLPKSVYDRIDRHELTAEVSGKRLSVRSIGAPSGGNDVRVAISSSEPQRNDTEGVTIIDRDGGLVVAFRGRTLLHADSFVPTIRYSGREYRADRISITRNGSHNVVGLSGELHLPDEIEGGAFEWNLVECVIGDVPVIFVDGAVTLPTTVCDTWDYPDVPDLARAFDSRWQAVEPCPLRLSRVEYEGKTDSKGAVVSRRNALGHQTGYRLDYHRHSEANWLFPSANNHLSQPFVGLSVDGMGLAVGLDEGVRSSFAGIPLRAVAPESRVIRAPVTTPGGVVYPGRTRCFDLNPFGTYDGAQWSVQSWGRGAGRAAVIDSGGHLASSAPTYNGAEMRISLVLAPFVGAEPREGVGRALCAVCRPARLFAASNLDEKRLRFASWRTVSQTDLDSLGQAPGEDSRRRRSRKSALPTTLSTLARIALQSVYRPKLRFRSQR